MTTQKIILSLFAALLIFSSSVKAAPEKPNLLIIMTDEHNFRTLGAYRKLMSEEQSHVWGKGVEVKTPNIDALAEQGALLTSYYGTTPLCSPARASFMSGLYPHGTGMPVNNRSINDDLITFAEVLSNQGYTTGYFGNGTWMDWPSLVGPPKESLVGKTINTCLIAGIGKILSIRPTAPK